MTRFANPWVLFLNDYVKSLPKQYKKIKRTEATKEAKVKWASMSTSQKLPWYRLSNEKKLEKLGLQSSVAECGIFIFDEHVARVQVDQSIMRKTTDLYLPDASQSDEDEFLKMFDKYINQDMFEN
ncbi:hypothetical protein C1645_813948 [Glomus cerebriforme]|uniref:Uncharacterized protein n=1 Tax=Glomus cerebriforme TaxID=658196 RepID=A0A397TM49_9GLOM|nr:hypothetical protein C1645_813948 [Glomus cerebriforme]